MVNPDPKIPKSKSVRRRFALRKRKKKAEKETDDVQPGTSSQGSQASETKKFQESSDAGTSREASSSVPLNEAAIFSGHPGPEGDDPEEMVEIAQESPMDICEFGASAEPSRTSEPSATVVIHIPSTNMPTADLSLEELATTEEGEASSSGPHHEAAIFSGHPGPEEDDPEEMVESTQEFAMDISEFGASAESSAPVIIHIPSTNVPTADLSFEEFASTAAYASSPTASTVRAPTNIGADVPPTPPTIVITGPGMEPFGADVPLSDFDLLKVVKEKLEERLPNDWITAIASQGIQVGLRLSCELLLVQRSAFFAIDGRVEAGLHGKRLPPDHEFWATVRRVTLSEDSVEEFICHVLDTVVHLRSLEVCTGVEQYRHLWKSSPHVDIDTNPFQERRYTEACRSKSCHLLVSSLKKKRCGECSKVWKTLNERNRTRPAPPEDVNTPPKNKPHKFLNTPEKAKRLHCASEEIDKLNHENQRLRKKIQDLINRDGVWVTETLSDDIVQILSSTEAVSKLTDFQRLFIEQQIKAVSSDNPRGRRWHPAMLRLAISIQSTSPAAYEKLSGILKLPSKRQLYNYTHCIEAKGNCPIDDLQSLIDEISPSSEINEG